MANSACCGLTRQSIRPVANVCCASASNSPNFRLLDPAFITRMLIHHPQTCEQTKPPRCQGRHEKKEIKRQSKLRWSLVIHSTYRSCFLAVFLGVLGIM